MKRQAQLRENVRFQSMHAPQRWAPYKMADSDDDVGPALPQGYGTAESAIGDKRSAAALLPTVVEIAKKKPKGECQFYFFKSSS